MAAEVDGRVRLAHAETNDKATLKRFADGHVGTQARVTTDGLASYDADSLGERPCERIAQSKAERRERDALQACHWPAAGLPLGDLAAQALAARHACRRGRSQASAGLSRRVRLQAEPAQDQGRRAHRRARHRAARGPPAAHHAFADRRHQPLPMVSAT